MDLSEMDFRIEDEVDFDAVDALQALQENLDNTVDIDTEEGLIAWA